MSLTQLFIYIHAAAGGVALMSGLGAILFKKGSRNHKRSGRIFYYAMWLSAGIALIVAVLPGHENLFLFTIGLFSLYFLVMGKRAILYKMATHSYKADILCSYVMLICSAAIPMAPLISGRPFSIVPLIFGIFGVTMAILNIRRFIKPIGINKQWLSFHIGHIMGGYIAAFTAFIVVNNFFPPKFAWVAWLAPGVLGGIYIRYWIRKTRPKVKPRVN